VGKRQSASCAPASVTYGGLQTVHMRWAVCSPKTLRGGTLLSHLGPAAASACASRRR
jgi:hypothetical protein